MEIPDKEVRMGTTGYAEAVQGNFDPAVIAFAKVSKFRKLFAAKRKAA